MKRTLISLITAFSAVSLAPQAAAVEKHTLKVSSSDYEVTVIEYNQDDAKKDYEKIQKSFSEVLSQGHEINWTMHYENLLWQKFESMDIPKERAWRFAVEIAAGYNFESFDPDNIPLMAGNGPYAIPPKVIDNKLFNSNHGYCAITTVGKNNTQYKKWFNSTSRREINNSNQFPETFSTFQDDFIRFHEMAHCLHADEYAADLIASLQVLNKYGDQYEAELTNFLKMHKNLRYYRASLGIDDEHIWGGFNAIVALNYWKKHRKSLTKENIWNMVYTNEYPKGIFVKEIEKQAMDDAIITINSISSPRPHANEPKENKPTV